jgi:hypothetical protein
VPLDYPPAIIPAVRAGNHHLTFALAASTVSEISTSPGPAAAPTRAAMFTSVPS